MNTETTSLIPQVGSLSQAIEWVEKRDAFLAEASSITEVLCDADLDLAGELQAKIAKHLKHIASKRLDLTRQIDELKKGIMDEEKQLTKALQLEHDRLKGLNGAYATHKYQLAEAERMRIEAEQRRAAEAAAESERMRIEEERKSKSEQQLRAENFFGAGTQPAQQQIPAVPTPTIIPQHTKPRTDSNTIAVVWDFVVINPADVPQEFLSVDERKIKTFLDMKKSSGVSANDLVIPGIKISVRADVRSR